MAIEKVIIQNFKKFKDPFEIKFNENINLLVGDNESGKSTILEAIHVALTGIYVADFMSCHQTALMSCL